MSVNDDAVALKGEKDLGQIKMPIMENYDIIIEDCTYGFCHSAFTLVVVSLSLAGM